MPYLQGITCFLIYRLSQEAVLLLFSRKCKLQQHFFFPLFCTFTGNIPGYTQIITVCTFQNDNIVILIYTIGFTFLKLFVKSKCPEGRLGNTAIGNQSKATVEWCKRNSLLFKHITKCPVGIGFIHISQSGKLLCYKGRIQVCIMNDALRSIGAVELRDMNLQTLIFRETVNNISGCF